MAYMDQEKKKSIAPKIKKLASEYGVKCSLSVSNHSTICLNIHAGDLNFLKNYNNIVAKRNVCKPSYSKIPYATNGHIAVNENTIEDNFSGDCRTFLCKAREILFSINYYNNSDALYDYFDIAYYVDINIGRYNKPYKLLAETEYATE